MIPVTAMTSVAEDVEERTREEKQIWEIPVDVCPVLREEEEADDEQEAAEGDVETAHKNRGKEIIPDDHHRASWYLMSGFHHHVLP